MYMFQPYVICSGDYKKVILKKKERKPKNPGKEQLVYALEFFWNTVIRVASVEEILYLYSDKKEIWYQFL